MEGKVEELVSAIADAIEATTGVAVDVEGDAEMPAEDSRSYEARCCPLVEKSR
jgi:hypothetical protein